MEQELLHRIAINATPLRPGDEEVFTAQLGRLPRGLVAVGARCACGKPAVTITKPRLEDGSPFPTLFYLSLPELVAQISRLEAHGMMAELNEELAKDPELAQAHAQAHHSYIERREILGEVPEIADVSAGGMPTRVKCLHALVGYSLSAGRGVCPLGDRALDALGWDTAVCHCSQPSAGAEPSAVDEHSAEAGLSAEAQ